MSEVPSNWSDLEDAVLSDPHALQYARGLVRASLVCHGVPVEGGRLMDALFAIAEKSHIPNATEVRTAIALCNKCAHREEHPHLHLDASNAAHAVATLRSFCAWLEKSRSTSGAALPQVDSTVSTSPALLPAAPSRDSGVHVESPAARSDLAQVVAEGRCSYRAALHGAGRLDSSPSGGHAAVATTAGVAVHDLQAGERVALLEGLGHVDADNVLPVFLNEKTVLVLVNAAPASAIRWSFATGKADRLRGHPRFGVPLAASPGRCVAWHSMNRWPELSVWSLETGNECGRIEAEDDVSAAAFSQDGRLLVFGDKKGVLYVWRPADGGKRASLRLPAHDWTISAVCALGRRSLVASASETRVKVWQGSEVVMSLEASGEVHALASSPSGDELAVGHRGGVTTYRVPSGQEQARLRTGKGCSAPADGLSTRRATTLDILVRVGFPIAMSSGATKSHAC